MSVSSFAEDPIVKRLLVASRPDIDCTAVGLLLQSKTAVAKPSYATYTWSPVGAEILFFAAVEQE
jgi:hypothetical protein